VIWRFAGRILASLLADQSSRQADAIAYFHAPILSGTKRQRLEQYFDFSSTQTPDLDNNGIILKWRRSSGFAA
jgi:hypothetical protein